MTGAVMPAGLDTVVPQEFVRVEAGRVTVPAGVVRTGDNRRCAGEDLAIGDAALRAGRAAAPGRHRPAGLARPCRGAGAAPPARRVLLDRRRAALARRAARPRLRLRQQPLHAVGDAAAPRRRPARPRRRARRPGRARGGVPARRRQRRRGHHLGRRQRRRGRPHQAGDGATRRRAVLAHRDAARAGRWRSAASRGRRDRRLPTAAGSPTPRTARSCSACPAIRSR